jgi:CheY-like chemotaxis protein
MEAMIPSELLVNESETHSDALLTQLATGVRQTLHNVLGAIELVSEEPLSAQQTDHLYRCRESVHELLRLANDVSELVDFSALGERPSRFDFSELLEAFSSLVSVRAAKKNLDLQWSVGLDVPRPVLGYSHAIETVLYRLVDNSLKFTEHGGVSISAKLRDRDRQFAKVAIEVSDTGPGIGQDVLHDLVCPVSDSQNRGLGLRLARKQLAAIGGSLEVVSSGGQGSTLAILVPVTIFSEDSNVGNEHARGAALRLLVAEDSDDSFAVFETFVKDEGHQVTRAINGAEAVDMFKSGSFDMVVMDVNMPVMDGYNATRTIRDWETHQGQARLPILLLSADDAGRQMRLGSAVGCSGYLTKPTPKQELLGALRHYSRETNLPDLK